MTIHHLVLEPFSHVIDRLDFTWNSETGELGGRDASRVAALAEAASRKELIATNPHPSAIPCSDPLRNVREFAALVGYSHRLPDWLREHYPKISPGPSEPGRVY